MGDKFLNSHLTRRFTKVLRVAAWAIIPISWFKVGMLKTILATIVILTTFCVIGYQVFFIGLYPFLDAAGNHYGITIWDNYFRKLVFEIPESIVQLTIITSLILVWTFFGLSVQITFK